MSDLIPKHGGYRKLKSFQVAQLVYDVTVRFCDKYVGKRSRTHDQMVQAARSGVQNIAEGSQASATSKKTELKLTQVARASLEELRLDYEDFLRQRGLTTLEPGHPVLMRFKARKPQTVEEFAAWVEEERRTTDGQGRTRTGTDNQRDGRGRTQTGKDKRTDGQGRTQTGKDKLTNRQESVPVGERPCQSLSSACLAANGALSLLNLACYFLDRQVERLARDFENEGGFTERLYKVRTAKRRNQP